MRHIRGSAMNIPQQAFVVLAILTTGSLSGCSWLDGTLAICEGQNKAATAEQVIEACTKIIDQGGQPSSLLAHAYDGRGRALGRKGKYDKALADFNHAIQLAPTNPSTLHNRGAAFAALGKRERALDDLNRAIALDPKFGLSYFVRGKVQSELDRPDLAIADLTEALRLKPDFAPAYAARGMSFWKKKNYEKALAAIAQFNSNQPIRLALASALAYTRTRGTTHAQYVITIKQFALSQISVLGYVHAAGHTDEWVNETRP